MENELRWKVSKWEDDEYDDGIHISSFGKEVDRNYFTTIDKVMVFIKKSIASNHELTHDYWSNCYVYKRNPPEDIERFEIYTHVDESQLINTGKHYSYYVTRIK